MSGTAAFDASSTVQPPPAHHVHQSSDRLPTRPKEQYLSSLNIQGGPPSESTTSTYENPSSTLVTPGSESAYKDSVEDNIGNSNANDARKSDLHPAFQEPNAHHSELEHGDSTKKDDLPSGKVKLTDKVIGKVEKVSGSITKNPNLQQKGELRETVGKTGTTE